MRYPALAPACAAPLVQVSRPPDPKAPGSSGGSVIANIISTAGTAALDFSGNDGIKSGVFTATLSAGGQVSRSIRRFGK